MLSSRVEDLLGEERLIGPDGSDKTPEFSRIGHHDNDPPCHGQALRSEVGGTPTTLVTQEARYDQLSRTIIQVY